MASKNIKAVDAQPIFPVITPLILVRRGPENEVGATIAHLTLGVGGGESIKDKTKARAQFWKRHFGDHQGIGNEKMRVRKDLNSLNLHK